MIGLGIDAEKLVGWRGASFGFEFLQFNGADTNAEAGSVAGYNGIVGAPPFQRTELLEAWYLQEMIKDVLQVRIGRSTPGYDFGNVLRPVALDDATAEHPGRGAASSTRRCSSTARSSAPCPATTIRATA